MFHKIKEKILKNSLIFNLDQIMIILKNYLLSDKTLIILVYTFRED
jgi:hypothetical protein